MMNIFSVVIIFKHIKLMKMTLNMLYWQIDYPTLVRLVLGLKYIYIVFRFYICSIHSFANPIFISYQVLVVVFFNDLLVVVWY